MCITVLILYQMFLYFEVLYCILSAEFDKISVSNFSAMLVHARHVSDSMCNGKEPTEQMVCGGSQVLR